MHGWRSTAPSVTVVIPSLLGGPALVALVESLRLQSGALDVVIADNGLPQHTRAGLSQADARVVAMGANLGFGAAINRAARTAEGDILVVLNDDIAPERGLVDALVAPFRDGADMVAGILLQQNAPNLIETAGVELDRTLGAADYLHNEHADILLKPVAAPFGPTGGMAAYRRSAFDDVGGFDEGFFAYFEDVDLAIRLRAAGARSALARDARALHASSGTLGYGSLAKANLVGFSRGYLLRKYGVLSGLRSGAAALAVETVAVTLLSRRHRSLQPGRARVRGWRSCRIRAVPPPNSELTVGLADAWRRRYVRASMRGSSAKP
jgi:GT2 family glycosyltransferase